MSRIFQGIARQAERWHSSGNRALGALQSPSAPCGGFSGFNCDFRLLVLTYHRAGNGALGLGWVKVPQSSLFLNVVQPFV